MKLKKLISSVLAFAVIFGTFAGFLPILSLQASAAENVIEEIDGASIAKGYLNQTFYSAQDKIDTDPYMELYASTQTHALYANRFTGEVYVKDLLSGQILTTNPYYIGFDYANSVIPMSLMSQFNLTFTTLDGLENTYNSYEWAASRGQVTMTPIGGGVRVAYTVGDTTARYLVPNGISKERFESLIALPAQEALCDIFLELLYDKLGAYDEMTGYENAAKIEGYLASSKDYRNMTVQDVIDKFTSYVPADYLGYYNEYEPKVTMMDTFDDWRIEVYKLYKVVCGGSFKLFSDMGNAFADYMALHVNYKCQDPNAYADVPVLRDNILNSYPATNEVMEDGRYFALYALSSDLTNNNKRKLQEAIAKYAPDYTMDMMYEDEAETQLEPEVEINPVFRLTLVYQLTEKGLEVSLPANSIFYDETNYTLVSIDVLPYMGSGNMNNGGYVFYPDGSGAIVDYKDSYNQNLTLSGEIYGHDYSFHAVTGANQESIRMPVYGSVSNQHLYYFIDLYTGEKAYVSADTYAKGEFTYNILSDEIKVEVPGKFDSQDNPVTVSYYKYYYTTDSQQKIYLPESDTKVEIKDGSTVVATVYQQYFINAAGNKVDLNTKTKETAKKVTVKTLLEESFVNGFFAIVENGAAMSSIRLTMEGASQNPYALLTTEFAPLPQDTYDLSEANSNADHVMFTVLSKEKFQEKLVIRYIMLTDEGIIASENLATDYISSYVGMANAYRDYLTDATSGILEAFAAGDVESTLPLYIETFGIIETTEKFLTIPVEVKVALTSFDDIKTMYKELSDVGISNVKFKLSGYANGGIGVYSNYPVKLKWERKVGGKSGFRDLLSFVSEHAEQGLQVFPDFDFQYIYSDRMFDGIRRKKIGARTPDNRYAIKKTYSHVTQEYDDEMWGWIVAPNFLTELYERFDRRYLRYDAGAISLANIAGELSSSYDEDEYVLREDAMRETVAMLAKVAEKYSVMSNGGNVYALQYVDYLLNAPIDSSHFRSASYTVPFFGMVMHGLVNYAGAPFNEEGNSEYQILRAIESGASLYFILSYANTDLLKEDMILNRYYSVNYQIWNFGYVYDAEGNYMYKDSEGNWHSLYQDKDGDYYYTAGGQTVSFKGKDADSVPAKYIEGGDVYKYYTKLNDAIGLLQAYTISDHRLIAVERVVEDAENLRDRKQMEAEYLAQLATFVETQQASKNADFRVLRDFYLDSRQILAEKAVQDIEENEIVADRDALKAEILESMSGDELAKYNKYITYLGQYGSDSEIGDLVKSLIINKLKDADIIAIIGEAPTATNVLKFTSAFINSIVNGKLSLQSDQKVGFELDADKLIADAMVKIGIDATLAELNDPTSEAAREYADFVTFMADLRALCQAKSTPAISQVDTAKITVTVEDLTYESQYSYVTYSNATDKDYQSTIYTIDDGTVVLVTYTDGTSTHYFVLNYNMFSVRVRLEGFADEIVIAPQDFYTYHN